MSDEIASRFDEVPAETVQVSAPFNPFQDHAPSHVSAGAVAIESKRAAAEIQGRMIVAKQWPRDTAAAYARVMDACRRPGLAQAAIYSYRRGGGVVSGPSIRLAEEMARSWGNIEYGIQELSRRNGESEMEAYAWDLETNTRSTQKFTVRHLRDKKGGAQKLSDERDVYEITANMGARRLRARILAILPPELIDDAVAACEKTRNGGGGMSLQERIQKMVSAFSGIGVTPKMLAAHMGHAVDEANPDEVGELQGVFQSIRDNATTISDWFSAPKKIDEKADPFEKAAAGAPS